ncbi:Optic atrophy 3 protein [Mactra antiquata]
MPLPLIKLASLFFKQISKRVSNGVKERAKHSPFFRKITMKPAQWYHNYEINFKLSGLGFSKVKKNQQINPDRAAELGADFIGEMVLYMLVGAAVVLEYAYHQKSTEKKKLEEREYLNSIESKIDEQSLEICTLQAELRQLQRTVGQLDSSNLDLKEKCASLEKKKSGWLW